jgi:hypothetical protein
MKRARLLILAILCAVWPAHAFAQWDVIEWAQPGSGPGPYRSSVGFFTRVFCVKEVKEKKDAKDAKGAKDAKQPTSAKAAPEAKTTPEAEQVEEDDTTHKVTWCFTDTDNDIKIVVQAQYGRASSDNPRFNDPIALLEPFNKSSVTIDLFDVSYSYRVSPLLDIGVAIGSYTYSGADFKTQSHLTFTPLRIEFVPFGFFRGDIGNTLVDCCGSGTGTAASSGTSSRTISILKRTTCSAANSTQVSASRLTAGPS